MQNNIFSQIIHIRVSIRKEYFMKTQKVIIGLALCGALGGGGYVGWNTPTSISATYTGNQAYQNDTITSEDFSVTENNIFGKAIKHIENFDLSNNQVTSKDNPITISVGNLQTEVSVEAATVTDINWKYGNGTTYVGDDFSESLLSGTVIFSDGKTVPLSSFSIDSPIDTFSESGENILHVKTPYGSYDAIVNVIGISEIAWNNSTPSVYEGDSFDKTKLKGNIIYEDGQKKTISDFRLLSDIKRFSKGGENILDIETEYGTSQAKIDVIAISGIEMQGTDIYAGKHKKTDFTYKLLFEDDSSQELSAENVSFDHKKIKLKAGMNSVNIRYNEKSYTVQIEALELTPVMKAKKIYKAEINTALYSHISDNLFITIQKLSSDNGTYFLSHVIVNDVSQFKGGLSYDDFGGTRELPTDVAKRTGSPFVTNGSYFSYDTGEPACGNIFIKDGTIYKNGTSNGYEVCLDSTGKLFSPAAGITASDLLNSGVTQIWGTADPLLINEGEIQDLPSETLHSGYYPRTALGMKAPGEYYFITADTTGYSGGLSFSFMQNKFWELGCTFARSLDGGGSSSLVFETGLVNSPATGSERPVVDFIYFTE